MKNAYLDLSEKLGLSLAQLSSELKVEQDEENDGFGYSAEDALMDLQNEEIRNMADLKIYSHTDNDIRLILKISRSPWFKKMIGEKTKDPRDFGGTVNSLPLALKFWWRGFKPGDEKYIIPTQKYADLVITYNEMKNLSENT